MKRLMIMVAIVAVVAAACASDDSAQPTDTLPMNDEASGTETEPIPTEPDEGTGGGVGGQLPVISEFLSVEVDVAVEDVRTRLGFDGLVEVVAAHDVTWPDGSLGCPEPDMSYTQALVDGYRVELAIDGDTYTYHGAAGEDPFLCENEREDLDAYAGSDPTTEADDGAAELKGSSPVERAQADLAQQLGIDPSEIEVVSHEVVTWSDSSAGCPSKGSEYMQVLTGGTLTILSAGGSEYRYHAAAGRTPFLCLIPIDPIPSGGGDT